MSTLTGQSLLQPLQARQRSSASSTSSLFQPSRSGRRAASRRAGGRGRASSASPRGWPCSSGTSRRGRCRPALADADAAAAPRAAKLPPSVGRRSGLDLRRRVAGPSRRLESDRVGIDDLAGVHLPVRVPDRLELAEGATSSRPNISRAARPRLAVAVLAGERAAVRDHEPAASSTKARQWRMPSRSRGRS
jgi:hypothetical protein